MLRALRGEPADRVPVWLMRQAGRYLPGYQALRRRYDFLQFCKTPMAAAEASVEPLTAVGSEAVIIFNDIMLPLEHAGANVVFDDHGPMITNPVRASADLPRAEILAVAADEPVAGTIREVRARVGREFPVLGFIGAPWTLATYWVEGRVSKSFEHILSLRWRDPETLTTLLDRITRVATEYLRVQIEAGADAVQIFDTWGSLLGSSDYERFSARWTRRIIEAVRPLGVPVIVYENGCAAHLPILRDIGADCVSVDWRIDLATARSGLKPGTSIQGNLDPTVLLAGPEACDREVRRLFENFRPGPGHVFNLGHGVLPGTSVESVRRVIEAVKRYGVYA